MKKILGLLLLTSPLFSMQLAYKMQPAHNRSYESHNSARALDAAFVKAEKQQSPYTISQQDTKKQDVNVKRINIETSSIRAPRHLSDIKLLHGKEGFVVLHKNKKHVVENRFMDQTTRKMTQEQLKSFLKCGFFVLNQTNDGTFTLKANHRLPGGGAFGAALGAFLGKAAVSVVGHGAIQIVALCTGPAYPVTVLALEGCFGPAIESASIAGAVAIGLTLGVATGPV